MRHVKKLASKAQTHRVTDLGHGVYTVISGESHTPYAVFAPPGENALCECPWSEHRPKEGACSHIVAVKAYQAEQANRKLSLYTDEEAARRQHRPTEQVGAEVWATSRKVGK